MSDFIASKNSISVNPLDSFEHGKACMNMAAEFFKKIFRYVPDGAHTYLWLKQEDKDGGKKITKSFVKNDTCHNSMAREAIWANRQNFHVFFGVNLPGRALSENERAKNGNIILQTAVIADVDYQSAWHVGNQYSPDFETAKSFLPFEPSILVDSGAGLHAYNLLETPIRFSNDEEREKAVSRNLAYIEMIRQNAGEFKVDSVQDLPRILRVPGTYNLKAGWENAPLCKVVSFGGKTYTVEELDRLIIPRPMKPAKNLPQSISVSDNLNSDDKPSDIERARAMLEKLPCSALDYDGWLHVGMALKNVGSSCDDWTNWSRLDDRFKDGECEKKWEGFNRTGFSIATIYKFATENGNYNEKDFRREWYKTHGSNANDDFDFLSFNSAELEKALSEQLQNLNFKLATFDAEIKSNVEKVKNQSTFDRDSVFADDILSAAAFAKLFDKNSYSSLKAAIQNHIAQNHTDKYFRDWESAVKEKLPEILEQQSKIKTEKNFVEARISSNKIYSADDVLSSLTPIDGYSVSTERGVEKVVGNRLVEVCAEPIAIKGVLQNYYDKKIKFILSHMRQGKWRDIPPQPAEVIASRRELVKLAAYGLPVADHNALYVVEYLYKLQAAHIDKLPFKYTVSNCGWNEILGQEFFVDPRRTRTIIDNENNKNIEVIVDNSSSFAKALTSKGSVDEWRKVYDLAKTSPIARLIVAACISPPLLKILGERNFLLYLQGSTGIGKTTAMKLGGSAVGNVDKIMRSFDATKNGLLGAAADVNDYPFLVDEKQSADDWLKAQFALLTYALGNGVGRTKLNKDSSIRDYPVWRTIAIMTGENGFLDKNVTAGAYTRLLTIHSTKTILDENSCREIQKIIKQNYGLLFPLVLDEILNADTDELNRIFERDLKRFATKFKDLLPVHCRYLAVMVMADGFLQSVLYDEVKPPAINNGEFYLDTMDFVKEIAPLLMTKNEISDAEREKDFVMGFISAKAAFFEGSPSYTRGYGKEVLGSFSDKDHCVYITVRALQQACDESHFDYKKVVADLIADKFFETPSDTENGRKNPRKVFPKKINEITTRCYKISKDYVEIPKVLPDDF